jgi:hypothetical protein
MVGLTGFEPVTLRLSSACSNQLSYRPIPIADWGSRISDWSNRVFFNPHSAIHIPQSRACGALVELRRLELLTYSLQSYRSTN